MVLLGIVNVLGVFDIVVMFLAFGFFFLWEDGLNFNLRIFGNFF